MLLSPYDKVLELIPVKLSLDSLKCELDRIQRIYIKYVEIEMKTIETCIIITVEPKDSFLRHIIEPEEIRIRIWGNNEGVVETYVSDLCEGIQKMYQTIERQENEVGVAVKKLEKAVKEKKRRWHLFHWRKRDAVET